MQSVLASIHEDFAKDVNAFIATIDDEPWRSTYQGMSRGELWLTRDEARQLSKAVEALIAPLDRGRSATRHPGGARRASMTWSLVPTEPPPDD
jgi:hypothetical protein